MLRKREKSRWLLSLLQARILPLTPRQIIIVYWKGRWSHVSGGEQDCVYSTVQCQMKHFERMGTIHTVQ